LNRLRDTCTGFRPFHRARSELVVDSSGKVFKGFTEAYGKIKGAPAFIAFIGDMAGDYIQEQVGYTGEGIILEATSLGLATCWIGGFFKPEVAASLVTLEDNERILAVTPVGYTSKHESFEERLMSGFGFNHRRRSLSSLVTGLQDAPDWARKAVETARLAPSAINRQPWKFHIEPDAIKISLRTSGPEFNLSKRLDCGIAMMHIEVAARDSGINGEWQFLNSPDVAIFKVIP
jgi:nitroreductase